MKSANEGIRKAKPMEPHVDDFAIRGGGSGGGGAPVATVHGDNRAEVDAVATWFARIGAAALVLAAAFAYSYAVDRGLITPPVRVALGVFAGAALLAASEWGRRRDWPAFAQAVAGAGVGMWYLVTWAAYERYDLIPGPAAFVTLAVVAATGVAVAWRHDSEVMAALAAIGAFLVPFLVANAVDPLPVLGYIALADAAFLVTVTVRPWRSIGRIAFFATWIFVSVSTDAAGPGASLAYGAIFWSLFALQPAVRAALGRRTLPEEAGFSVANAFAFWAFSMAVTTGTPLESLRGAITALLGAAYLGLWASVRETARNEVLATALLGLAGGLFAMAVPIQFEGPAVAAGWTVQAVILVAIGRRAGSPVARGLGVGLLGVAIADSLLIEYALGAAYAPARPLVSGDAMLLLLQVGALHVSSRLLRDARDPWEGQLAAALSVGGHVLALVWGAFEALAHWLATVPAPESAIQYSLTVEWSLYAAALMTAGVLMRRRRARMVALTIFVVTIVKVALIDLWMLATPHRVVALGALGLVLLGCSLLYHRFRALIMET